MQASAASQASPSGRNRKSVRPITIGGRSGGMALGPYVFDVGSTMLMMRFVLAEMFELAGRRLEDELEERLFLKSR